MKKISLIFVLSAIYSSLSFASVGVAIQWTTIFGVYYSGYPDIEDWDNGGIRELYGVTWQLIYSLDSVANAPDINNAANGWVSGDDVVWATRILNQGKNTEAAADETMWDVFVYYQGGDRQYIDTGFMTSGGSIYQRLYQGDVDVGTWYCDSAVVPLVISPITVQEFYFEGSAAATHGVQPNQQVQGSSVPEPATMALLGLGALTMALRRRRA